MIDVYIAMKGEELMIDVDVLKKMRDGLLDNTVVVVSCSPQIDRLNLIEVLTQEIAKQEKKRSKNEKETS